MTDGQWELVEPTLPPIKSPGRIPKHPRRVIVDAFLCVVRSGCSWRQLPADFPPWQTVYWQFQQWERRRVTERILEGLREQVRIAEGREPEPSAGVLDSQSFKAADTVGRDNRGYDAGQRVNGRKGFVTDTLGLLVVACVMPASWQDREGAKATLLSTYLGSPIRHVFADLGFGKLVDWSAEILKTTLEIVRTPADQQGFVVHPKRWVVERSFAWLTAHRRLARDCERDPTVSEAFIRWVAINTTVRGLHQGRPTARQARRTFNTSESQPSPALLSAGAGYVSGVVTPPPGPSGS
ncbi:IS5 family transposase [Actinoplanes sp. NPDC051513]|uniref:IS5 family transposase n=1 Tax=Actinoplanes sp. NPDC051513 TaxID=3363908 RepID=UPI0037B085B9